MSERESSHEIAGWATLHDGRRVPIDRETADAWWAEAVATKEKRASDMPTEQDAINTLWSAYQRLKELDWNDAIYCPKDGSAFDVIEAGSTGIHSCVYVGEWPDGMWLINGDDPSRPILYRRTEAEKARWADLAKRFHRESIASSSMTATPPSSEPTP